MKCTFCENIRQQLVNTQRMCVISLNNQIIQLIFTHKIWFSKGKSDLMQSWEVPAIKHNSLDTVPEPLVTQRWISCEKSHIPHLCHTFFSYMLPSASGHTMLDWVEQDHILTQHVQKYVTHVGESQLAVLLLSLTCWAVCYPFLTRFYKGTPSIPDGLWPTMNPFWNQLELGAAPDLCSQACIPSPHSPCKPNTVCVSQHYKDDRNTSRDVRGMTHMPKRRKVFTKADLLHTLAVGKGRSCALLEMSWRSLSPPPHWQPKAR